MIMAKAAIFGYGVSKYGVVKKMQILLSEV